MRKYSNQWHAYESLKHMVAKRFGADKSFVHEDHIVDVDDDVQINEKDVLNGKLIYKFGTVSRSFIAYGVSLETMVGFPIHVGITFSVKHNNITDIIGIPKNIGKTGYLVDNHLTNLKNIHKLVNVIGGELDARRNPIRSHVMGVLLIPSLARFNIDNGKVSSIINKHLSGERNAFACQEELIQAGFAEYAKI